MGIEHDTGAPQGSPQELTAEEQEHLDKLTEENERLNRGEDPESKTPETPPEKHEPPEWLDESMHKYFDEKTGEVNHAAMAEELRYLRKKAGEAQKEKPEGDQKGSEGDSESTEDDSEAKTPAVDFESLAQEIATEGQLSDDSLAQLEKLGITRDMAAVYQRGLESSMNEVREAAFEVAGGEDEYKAMLDWAGKNLPDKEIEAFDAAVRGLDAGAVKQAVSGLYEKYAGSVGRDPEREVTGDADTGTGGAGFATQSDMTAAINDPRYGTDPAYTRQVRERIVATNF